MRTRKTIATTCALAILSALLVVSVGNFTPLYADEREASAPQLEGTWEVTVLPVGGKPIVDLATFTAGGGIINTDPDPNLSTGHGTWVRNGGNQFAVTFVHFLSDQGAPVGTLKVRSLLQRDSHTTMSGPFRTDVFIGGNLVQSVCGTIQATRVMVEPVAPCP
jgi:hypothetical protein